MDNIDFVQPGIHPPDLSRSTATKPEFISRQVWNARYFFFTLHPDAGAGLVVACGGCEHCLPAYRVHREDFPYYSVEYVLRGQGELVVGDRRMQLRAGALFAYGPGRAHTIRTDPNDPLVKYFVDFSGSRAQALLEEAALLTGELVWVTTPQRIMDLYESMLQNGTRDTAYSARICTSLLELLLLKVAENRLPEDGGTSQAFSTYLRCRQGLEERYPEWRSLADMAEGCHVDAAYLCRLFQRFDSQSPYQRLTRLKMNRAAELLTAADWLVKEVADEVGYPDPYHFSRVFKKVYGVAPEHFARRGVAGKEPDAE